MADNETPLGWLTYPNAGDRSWFSSDAQGQGIADWLARVELLGVPTYATYADLPDPTTTPTASNTGGFTQRQFAAVVGDATVYRSDGSNWIPWLGSGTLNRRLPDTRYFDSADANDMSVQNAPTSASDVARQAELDGKADDPHDNAAHSETYATTTQLSNKADDPHDNAAHSESYTTTDENVENFGTGGATNAVPVSQGDGTLQMQTTVENSDKLDGLDASDFNTDSDTGQTSSERWLPPSTVIESSSPQPQAIGTANLTLNDGTEYIFFVNPLGGCTGLRILGNTNSAGSGEDGTIISTYGPGVLLASFNQDSSSEITFSETASLLRVEHKTSQTGGGPIGFECRVVDTPSHDHSMS
jgi:hypothetical protein